MGYGTGALWDLCNRYIATVPGTERCHVVDKCKSYIRGTGTTRVSSEAELASTNAAYFGISSNINPLLNSPRIQPMLQLSLYGAQGHPVDIAMRCRHDSQFSPKYWQKATHGVPASSMHHRCSTTREFNASFSFYYINQYMFYYPQVQCIIYVLLPANSVHHFCSITSINICSKFNASCMLYYLRVQCIIFVLLHLSIYVLLPASSMHHAFYFLYPIWSTTRKFNTT